MRNRSGWVIGIVAAVVVVGLALAWSHFRVPSAPGSPTQTLVLAGYYPACGNETLVVDGTTWYPIKRSDWQEPIFDAPTPDATAGASGASGGRGIAASVPMVAAPGPGDDHGTLLVYDNGIAYWNSDSGNIHTWLTTAPQTYNWVC